MLKENLNFGGKKMKSITLSLFISGIIFSPTAYSDHHYIPGPNDKQVDAIVNLMTQYLNSDPSVMDAQLEMEKIKRQRHQYPSGQTQPQQQKPTSKKTFCECSVTQTVDQSGHMFYVGNLAVKTEDGQLIKAINTGVEDSSWSDPETLVMNDCKSEIIKMPDCRSK
ncbi:MAG: hypothetical protein A4S09_10715 [Proteobacteria bacterium SG_bin7]|nr:MAG: hypothetical protein A4S09_10715 [Proteobacteria bacterium SG_bin7]